MSLLPQIDEKSLVNGARLTQYDPTKSFKKPALVSECITSPCYYLVLLAVEGYSLLSRPGFHGFLVGVVLTDVDVSLALELANLIEKTTQVL